MKPDYEAALKWIEGVSQSMPHYRTLTSALRIAADWPHTADGVPVRFDMEVWAWDDSTEQAENRGKVVRFSDRYLSTASWCITYTDSYSTAAACRAANEKPKPEPPDVSKIRILMAKAFCVDPCAVDVANRQLAYCLERLARAEGRIERTWLAGYRAAQRDARKTKRKAKGRKR